MGGGISWLGGDRFSFITMTAAVRSKIAAGAVSFPQPAVYQRKELQSMHEEMITSAADGRTVEGYLVVPDGTEQRPAVIVVHEIWGF